MHMKIYVRRQYHTNVRLLKCSDLTGIWYSRSRYCSQLRAVRHASPARWNAPWNGLPSEIMDNALSLAASLRYKHGPYSYNSLMYCETMLLVRSVNSTSSHSHIIKLKWRHLIYFPYPHHTLLTLIITLLLFKTVWISCACGLICGN